MPDLVVANRDSNSVSVLLNTTATGGSQATFSNRPVASVGINPIFVGISDLNADGKNDLAVALYGENKIQVLFG